MAVSNRREGRDQTDLDSILRQLGNFGRYQTLQFCLLCLYGSWFTAWLMMAIIFTASTPQEYHCTPPTGFTANEMVPCENTDGAKECDKCQMYAVHGGIVTRNMTGCEYGWDYVMAKGKEATIATDVSNDMIFKGDMMIHNIITHFFPNPFWYQEFSHVFLTLW